MDATDLKVFEAVARLGGMSRAAAELNTVQSNVTQRIRALEGEVGLALFHRHSRGVTLSDAGRRLLPHALAVVRALDDALRAARDEGTPQGPLVIGSLETVVALHLSSFAAVHPAVDLGLRTGTSAELVEEVLQRRLEGAFVCGPVSHPELDQETLFDEELVILTATGLKDWEAEARRGALKIVVLRVGCSYRQRLEDVLAKRGIVGLRRLEFGTLEAIYGSVAAGIGLTLLPKRLIGSVWRDGRVAMHRIPAGEAQVETVFIRRRDGFLSSALAAFLDSARAAQPSRGKIAPIR
jgi:DNA-binding transcriptional LysR family regulator